MTNSKQNADKHDKYGINVNDKHEIEYWSIKLKVSIEELLKAVEQVGNSSIDVIKYLKNGP